MSEFAGLFLMTARGSARGKVEITRAGRRRNAYRSYGASHPPVSQARAVHFVDNILIRRGDSSACLMARCHDLAKDFFVALH
jgi:hypothetical protein